MQNATVTTGVNVTAGQVGGWNATGPYYDLAGTIETLTGNVTEVIFLNDANAGDPVNVMFEGVDEIATPDTAILAGDYLYVRFSDNTFVGPTASGVVVAPQLVVGKALSDYNAINGRVNLYKFNTKEINDFAISFVKPYRIIDGIRFHGEFLPTRCGGAGGLTPYALGPITQDGTVAYSAIDSSRFVRYDTGAVNGNDGGIRSQNFDDVDVARSFEMYITLRAGAAGTTGTSNTRIWAGLVDAAIMGEEVGSNVTARKFIAFGYNPAVSANWRVMTGDGANKTSTNTTIAYSDSRTYILYLRFTPGSALVNWTIYAPYRVALGDGASGVVSLNVPSAVKLGAQVELRTLSANNRVIEIAGITVQTPRS